MKRHARYFGMLVSVLVVVAGCTPTESADGEQRLPVYEVVRTGPSASQVTALASELSLGEAVTFENAIVDFFAPERFAYVPTGATEVGSSFDEEEGGVVTYEAIDFGALDALQIPTTDEAARQLGSALDAAGLTELFPQGGSTQVTQETVFEWQASGATASSSVVLDARVAYDFTLTDDRLPLLGPGATVYATFDGDGATSLRYAFRGVETGEDVAVLSDDEAMSRCSDALGRTLGEVNVSTRMVYYAPPLELGSVAILLPHVECSGTATVDGEQVALLQQLLPAVEDANYVPNAELDVLVEGADVRADVRIDGGRAPTRSRGAPPTSISRRLTERRARRRSTPSPAVPRRRRTRSSRPSPTPTASRCKPARRSTSTRRSSVRACGRRSGACETSAPRTP
ncbi:MAG: hypothetical protein U5J97_02605 [Trueperaceae bacterium]|nr:hypothetical protein [Trueperaceae bacterium]